MVIGGPRGEMQRRLTYLRVLPVLMWLMPPMILHVLMGHFANTSYGSHTCSPSEAPEWAGLCHLLSLAPSQHAARKC